MNYRRVLFLTELGGDARPAVSVIRRVAPAAERLIVMARLPVHKVPWLSQEAPADLNEAATSSLDALREATAGVAGTVEVKLAPNLDANVYAGIAAELEIDLVAAGPPFSSGISVLSELRTRRSLALLWTAGASSNDRPIRDIVCVALGSRARAAVAAFLRDHGTSDLHCTVVVPHFQATGSLASTLGVLGIEAQVELATPTSPRKAAVDLLVLARFPSALLAVGSWPAPILILPPVSPGPWRLRRAIDIADLVDLGGVLRARLAYASSVGRRGPLPDQEVAFVTGGRIVALPKTAGHEAEIAAGDAESFGIFRVEEKRAADPVAAVEQEVAVIRPGSRPLLLFDSDLEVEDLSLLGGLRGPDAPELLAVRMRPMRSCRSIRARLRTAGIPPRVVDASAVLDEGDALDVPEEVDPVRLARVAARMRGTTGFPVAAIVYRGPHTPHTIGFAALRAAEISAATRWHFEPPEAPRSVAARLEATTGASLITGNRIELEMDNAKARRWLLDGIAGARSRVHFQVYMAKDDDVGTQVESALAAAGARGVSVRVVVDSLHGLEGSLGTHNPLLQRLRTRPGVEFRVSRPITSVPSLEDLKQRDHRKTVIIDGTLALLGGRNLSHEYYTGFDEAKLTPRSLWREVPWLDAGARVEGPAVAALERSFLDAWTGAGGSPVDVAVPPPAGTSPARVILHHGLRDARTLEAYLALIDSATSHVYTVNGFPLILEIQHALLRAVRRGVRVRTLFGNLTPTHDGTPFGGPWSTARTAATELVHSRMDAVAEAGGEAYQLAVGKQPGWSPSINVIYPHVHAKVMSVDGRVCSVGSANLDITAGYWESELILVVEDTSIVRAFEAGIDQLIAGSKRVERDDPAWQQTAKRRHWMQHWPGVLSV